MFDYTEENNCALNNKKNVVLTLFVVKKSPINNKKNKKMNRAPCHQVLPTAEVSSILI